MKRLLAWFWHLSVGGLSLFMRWEQFLECPECGWRSHRRPLRVCYRCNGTGRRWGRKP